MSPQQQGRQQDSRQQDTAKGQRLPGQAPLQSGQRQPVQRRDQGQQREQREQGKRQSARNLSVHQMLELALDRAEEAITIARRLQTQMQRSTERKTIQRSIALASQRRSQLAQVVYASFFANLAILAAIFFTGGGLHITTVGTLLTTFARLAGLLATYLLLVQLLLVARLPVLDNLYGLDRLTRWHKANGHLVYVLIVVHVVAVVLGRAFINHITVMAMTMTVMRLRFMIPAALSVVVITASIVTSIGIARSKIGHRKWHWVHSWTYLGVALSFGHQLFGPDFAARPMAQGYIWVLFGATFGIVGFYRVALPLQRAIRHQLRVVKIVKEGPGVVSLYMTGFGLNNLRARPGQFFYWRFLTGHDWREAHPYSLSVAPNNKFLRITVKTLGDASGRAAMVPKGTWVTFEGPFGGFTPEARTSYRTVLIAGGVGITPVRSLLEGMASAPGDMVVVYRANKLDDALLLNELQDIAARRQAELHIVLGEREAFPPDCQPLTPRHLRSLVPDLIKRDVYICASPTMTMAVRASLKTLGLPPRQVHHETFV